MIEKIKNIFTNKEKRVENLISFLIILIITLIVINKILKSDDEPKEDYKNEIGVELATISNNSNFLDDNLEKRLEKIMEKIEGVGKVSVLITYSETSSIVPVYNINSSTSTTEETDTSGGTRKVQTENNQKDIITDSGSNIITEKILSPKIEGAVITAKGASDGKVKSNIIDAVTAVTGIPAHKIQVFEMGDD